MKFALVSRLFCVCVCLSANRTTHFRLSRDRPVNNLLAGHRRRKCFNRISYIMLGSGTYTPGQVWAHQHATDPRPPRVRNLNEGDADSYRESFVRAYALEPYRLFFLQHSTDPRRCRDHNTAPVQPFVYGAARSPDRILTLRFMQASTKIERRDAE